LAAVAANVRFEGPKDDPDQRIQAAAARSEETIKGALTPIGNNCLFVNLLFIESILASAL